jgi:hypothetical protein
MSLPRGVEGGTRPAPCQKSWRVLATGHTEAPVPVCLTISSVASAQQAGRVCL